MKTNVIDPFLAWPATRAYISRCFFSDEWDLHCSREEAEDWLKIPLTIIIIVFSIIAFAFLGLGAKMVYKQCLRGASRGFRGEGRGESLSLRSVAVSPSSPLRGGDPGEGGEGREGRGVVRLPSQPPSYTEAVQSGAQYKDDPPKYSEIAP